MSHPFAFHTFAFLLENRKTKMNSSENIFRAFELLNVLIVGDVMIDRYLYGKVTRVSPEAPVPVVHFQQSDNRLGGAANVALNIKALGATPYLCSVIGKDENAAQFLNLLPEYNLPERGLIQSAERITTVKTRVIANNQHLLRVDQEEAHDLSEQEAKNLLTQIQEILDQQEIHVILFQDYNKGVLSSPLIQKVIEEALKRNIPTAVDPKHKNFWAYKQVTLFKPNLKEIQDQLPAKVLPTLSDLKKASNYVRSKLNNQYTLVTLSEKGLFVDGADQQHLIGTQPRAIADVCGAGDTVISVVALGLALGLDMKETAVLSNLAGGQVCEKVGVVPVNKVQLEEEFDQLLQGNVK